METNEIKSLSKMIDRAVGTEDKGFLKTLAENKFVIGSTFVVTAMTVYKAVKTISVSGIASKLLPSIISNVTLMGMPLGSMMGKLLSMSIAGTLVIEVFKVHAQIKEGKKSKSQILFDEAVSMIILIFAFILLGSLGANLINSANSLSIPAF
jgi:hypothetical protein